MPILVIESTFLPIGQHCVGLRQLFEPLFGSVISGVFIRMALNRQLSVGFLNFSIAGVTIYAQDFIIIALAHRIP
jgi:hypothetical protein